MLQGLLALTMAMCASVSATQESEPKNETPRLTVEFRRAESEPAEGLQAAEVRGTKRKVYLYPKAEVTLADVEAISREKTPDSDDLAILIRLTKQGAENMRKLTGEHIGKPLAILVNREVVRAPVVREQLSNRLMISGLKEAEVDAILKQLEGR